MESTHIVNGCNVLQIYSRHHIQWI